MSKLVRSASKSLFTLVGILGSFAFLDVLAAQEGFAPNTFHNRRVLDLTLIDDASPQASQEPLAASTLTMPTDAIPPFAAHPKLEKMDDLSFEENVPVDSRDSLKIPEQSIDECCTELAAMIAGNLDSEISVESKQKMVEMALKMVARNVALKAEAKVTMMEANHALERSQLYSQLASLRATSQAPLQMQRVMTPVYRALDRNYLQASTINQTQNQMAQKLATMQKFIDPVTGPRERDTIRLTSTVPESIDVHAQQHISQRIAELERELVNMRAARQPQPTRVTNPGTGVRQASWNESMLGPMPNRQPQENYRSPAPYVR